MQVQNARDAMRDHVASAQRAADRLVVDPEPMDDFVPAPRPAVALVKS